MVHMSNTKPDSASGAYCNGFTNEQGSSVAALADFADEDKLTNFLDAETSDCKNTNNFIQIH